MIHSIRKDEHVLHALEQYSSALYSDFEKTRFVHHALPELNIADIDISSHLSKLSLKTPFFINAMTGGSERTKQINRNLAIVARECDLALATGSLSVALKDPSTEDSFTIIRDVNPSGLVFANLGAHHKLDSAKRAVDLLKADALQIHLNSAQELVMPEGDRVFSSWLTNIEEIVKSIDVPVIVKEVGFGLSRETIAQLVNVGVNIVDVSGHGGTNFVKIEDARRSDFSYAFLNDWGQSTVISLLEAHAFNQSLSIIASGGIKNAMDMAKSLCLGANAVGLSGTILYTLTEFGIDKTIEHIMMWKEQLQTIMGLLGAKNINELQHKQIIVSPTAQNWADARHIDWKYFANRIQ